MGQSPDSINYTGNSDDTVLIQGNADLNNGIVVPRIWSSQITKKSYPNDIIFTVRAPVGEIARNPYFATIGRGVASFKGNDFLYQSLIQKKENNYWNNISAGSTFDSINSDQLKNVIIDLPKNNLEQGKIGELFTNLDNLITLHHRKFSDILVYKLSTKFLFLKFAKNVWEQRKAKDLCSITTGKSNTQDQVQDGKYPFYIRSDVPVRSNRYLYDEEAVITIGDGNIGRVFHYVNGKFDLHQRCYKMADFKALTAKYFYYYFSTKFYERAMSMTAKATVDSVRLEMISDMEIKFPKSTTEQTNISELFTNLDNLITLHHRKYTYIFYSWEQRKFENIFNYERPDKYIVNSTEYLEFGPTPVLTANKAFILGYTTEKNKYVNSHESIIFDDFTLDTKFVDFPYMVKSSAIKILTLKDEKKDNIRFNFELLSNHRFNMLGHARHYISVVQPEEVFTTNKQEQNKIGELFTNLDNLITLHQHKELKRRNDNNEHLRW